MQNWATFSEVLLDSAALMTAMDAVNRKYGKHTLRPAVMGYRHVWQVKVVHRSPAYTTRLQDVPKVRAI